MLYQATEVITPKLVRNLVPHPSFLPETVPLEVFFSPIEMYFDEEQTRILHQYDLYFLGQPLMMDKNEISSYGQFPNIQKTIRSLHAQFVLNSVEAEELRTFYYEGVKKFRWLKVVSVFEPYQILYMYSVADTLQIVNFEITRATLIKDDAYRILLKYRKDRVSLLYRMSHLLQFFAWLEKKDR